MSASPPVRRRRVWPAARPGAGLPVPFALRRARAGRWLRRTLTRGLADPLTTLDEARGEVVLWAPIALACGIGGYFLLPVEPGAGQIALAVALAGAGLLVWARGPGPAKFLAALVALTAIGLLAAVLRAQSVAAPVLSTRYYGPVEGRIVEIDRSARDAIRLTLDRIVLRDLAPDRRPATVRVALLGPQTDLAPEPGMRVMLTASLSPPSGPAEPGGWDFRRSAFFERLGGVGYSRTPVMLVAPPEPGDWGLAGYRLRMRLSAAMQAQIGGQAGAVAAALMTGDRSGIAAATNDVMRGSNLYHLVSISGLHMGMLAGFVFGALRYGLAALGNRTLTWPVKKIAAAVALVAATLYLWVAGPQVATQRAWIMVSVMLVAVLLDRRAISLRTVAIAALVLLLWQPESLTAPGFQMSFAATVALILVARPWGRVAHRLPVWARPVLMLLLTSLVAGLATAPIAAAHFNRMSQYGMLANLLAVPVMGTLVMPAGVIAALLAPFGLAAPALWVMGLGTRWVLAVAAWVAGLDGSVSMIPAPAPLVLPLLALGATLAVVARGPLRLAATALACAALVSWAIPARAPLLIAPEGALVGLIGPEGRVLSKSAGSFVGDRWLEADGDRATTAEAAARPGFSGPKNARRAEWRGRALVHLTGKGAEERLAEVCHEDALVVLGAFAPRGFSGDCTVYDRRSLARSGALALWPDGRITAAAEVGGNRIWTGASK